MKARLFSKTGQLAGANFEVGSDAMIGKSADCAIQLYPQLISSRHARIYFDEKAQRYFLEDLGSRNGTKLDGVRVKGKEPLGALHVITFANTFDFLFQVVDESKQQPAPPPPQAAKAESRKTEFGSGYIPQPVPSPAQQPSAERVQAKTAAGGEPSANVPSPQETRQKTIFESGPFVAPPMRVEPVKQDERRADMKVSAEVAPTPAFVSPPPPTSAKAASFALVFDSMGKSFELKEGTTFVGRDVACGVMIDDGSVSRKHAEFTLKGDKLTLKDLGSKNHTYINDQKISGAVEVHEGVSLTFGVVKARVIKKDG